MTLIGKIFIVLILIMSIVFMSFAVCVYSTHQNWKELVSNTNPSKPGLRQQLRTVQDRNGELEAQIDKLKQETALERAARRGAISALEQTVQEKERDFSTANQAYQQLLSQQETAIKTVDVSQTQLSQLKTQIGELRANIVEAQRDRDAQFARVRKLTDDLNQAENLRSTLEQRLQQLTDLNAQATTVLKAHDLTVNSPVTNIPPAAEGRVTSVRNDLVQISLGSDDGIKAGHTVEVARRGRYLGRVKITRVTPDRAVGRVLPDYRKAPIVEGDSVQTKIH